MEQPGEIAVLHVDDEPDLADTVAEFLEREDERLTVDTATNADDALETLADGGFDCIVSDYDMPGRNGIEFLEAVRNDDPDMPFILFTGKGSEEIASEAISAGVTDYLQKRRGTTQYAVLANKIANAVAKYRSAERAETMDRIRRILRDVDQLLVRSRTREEIESGVCRVLSRTGSYCLAWIGTQADGSESVRPCASAGEATSYLDEMAFARGDDTPTGRAISERELTTAQSVTDESDDPPWRRTETEHGFRGAAAVPLIYDDTSYGVLTVYSTRPGFFDDRERELLVEVGEDIGHAIHRAETERKLREQRSELRVYERAVESSSDLLAGIDTDYTLIFANEPYREFHGISEEDIGERSLPDVLGEAWEGGIKEYENRVLDGEVVRYEAERTGPDGESRTFSVQDYPLLNEDGEILGVVGSMRDITDRTDKEQELRQLKERLDLAVEAANIGVWDWNVQTDEVQFNDQWAEMLGHDPAEIDPHLDAWEKRVHPEDMETAQAELNAHLDGETEYYECEHRMRTADGSWKWIRDIGRVTERTADGDPVRAVGIHLDIDDRKEQEQALRESERRYRSLFESNPAVVWVEDFSEVVAEIDSLRDEGIDVVSYLREHPEEARRLLAEVEIIDVSEQAVERYGADSKADLLDNLDDIFTERAYEANAEIWRRLASGETHFRVPTVAQTVDGERLDEIIDVKVPEAYADDYSRIYLTVMDITERKRRERKLTALHDVVSDLESGESAEYICQRTVEASQDILEFDLSLIDLEEDGSLRSVATSEDIPAQETADMSVDEGIAGKTYQTGESMLIDRMENHEEAKPQGAFQSGLSIPIGDHGVFQAVAEEPESFDESDLELAELLISHTEGALNRLKRERKLEAQNERLEQFTNIVSHDLRNPLRVAQNQLELIRQDHDIEGLDVAMRAHERMERLINDLLARALDGGEDLTIESVDLRDAIQRCWETVETTEATVIVDTDHTIRADRGQLAHLLENLIRNAMEHAGPEVTVTIGDLEAGFFVEDDGPGVSRDEQSAIFETGYSTQDEGTGYGLTIVEQAVDAHGWDIEVTEGSDGGARFEITDVDVE